MFPEPGHHHVVFCFLFVSFCFLSSLMPSLSPSLPPILRLNFPPGSWGAGTQVVVRTVGWAEAAGGGRRPEYDCLPLSCMLEGRKGSPYLNCLKSAKSENIRTFDSRLCFCISCTILFIKVINLKIRPRKPCHISRLSFLIGKFTPMFSSATIILWHTHASSFSSVTASGRAVLASLGFQSAGLNKQNL